MSTNQSLLKETLQLIEIFSSVQGETSFTGLPTTFVRLAACNLRCSWCDTTYSFGRGSPSTFGEIIDFATSKGNKNICITGGEPLLQEGVYSLMHELCERKFILSLETGGSLPISRVDPRVHIILDIKCPGSGMEKKNCWLNLPLLKKKDEVKFVVSHREDYAYAREVILRENLPEKVDEILLSPVFGVLDPKELISWMLEDRLPVRLNLQVHKFIWSPTQKGV